MEYASRNWLKLPQLQSKWLQDKQNLESKTLYVISWIIHFDWFLQMHRRFHYQHHFFPYKTSKFHLLWAYTITDHRRVHWVCLMGHFFVVGLTEDSFRQWAPTKNSFDEINNVTHIFFAITIIKLVCSSCSLCYLNSFRVWISNYVKL